jgi:hypothetical protein
MKISQKPTEYILVRAHTNSEWDICDCALVTIDNIANNHYHEWRKLDTKANLLKNEYPIMLSIEVFTHNVEFLDLVGVDDKWEESLLVEQLPKQGWAFVEIEENDEHITYKPTQTIQGHTIKFYGESQVVWTGLGKHTGEEFFTDTISLADIINAINSYQC